MFSFCVIISSVSLVLAQETLITYNILEEQGELTYVGNVARDSFLYQNYTELFPQMKFQILTQGNLFASMFTIDESASTLRTGTKLDREDICPYEPKCVLNFNVAVYLKDLNTDVLDLFKIIKIQVFLDDINDNTPEFPNSEITMAISENSEVKKAYFTPGAFDLDTGANNSVQKYVMDPQNEMFGLELLRNLDGTSDLNIVVNYPLDRESRSFYQLYIYAIDGGFPVRTGSVKINITITDQNDNAPIFTKTQYGVTVEENTPINSTILIVTALDADADDNGNVSYRFSSRTPSKVKECFNIDITTGEIKVKSILDYEDKKNWTFKVEAFDHGNPAKTSTCTVVVTIRDTNDNYPQININLPPGGPKISEAADTGHFVAHLVVFDHDEGVNGEVKCKVLGDDFRLEDFKIENNFKVVLNKPLDYEKQDSYEVTVECEDGGSPPKKNETSISVKVEDKNDNYPEFLFDVYEQTFQEEVFQSIIVQVSATDADSGELGKVTYGLQSNTDPRFKINSKTGLITANSIFDREVDPIIIFNVLAWDNAEESLTSTATVVINVTDINDNAPKFPSNPVEIYFLEEQQAMQTQNLNVTDPDFGPNGQFDLIFPKNNYLLEYFHFNAITGEIKTLKPIDREEIAYFKFMVKAVDRGIPQLTSTAEVIIHISDSNDNIPAITYPNNGNNTKFVPVTSPVGFYIATVVASDKDDGLNAQLLYFIDEGDDRELFKIDVNTGIISVGREMTEKDAEKYKLQLAVRDNGTQQRTSYATLHVVVQPANETSLMNVAEENKQNIMLVAIFVAITVFISIAIISSIFILRYVDKRNRARTPPKINENRFYDAPPRIDESMSATSSVSKDSDTELLKKRAKKEVSFSIDEDYSDPGNNSTLTNVTSFSTVKPSYLSMDFKSPEDTQSSTWLCNNTMSSDMSKQDMYSEKELSSLTHSQLQNGLHHIAGGNSDRLWLQPVREEESKHMMKRADDNHSETSHETATSDSGRGGSEEDIHSNRGHPLSDTAILYQCYV
ncbi:protocadherin-11 X-linked-like isoform X2 [Ruditapes philippinarum]|uniref:protocadherin-11 X-linked-like isoform X2 n=1 Tax=Ruditapes philippinarum TaxID=129788 RepID=UPI00295B8F6C|nr:protocadherin-11 X-linked-like isoform X2 [Ruditapes philippinarum]